MAFLSLVVAATVLAIIAITKYIDNSKRNRLPAGVQKLPGPKGMLAFLVLHWLAQDLEALGMSSNHPADSSQAYRSLAAFMNYQRRTAG